jgi:hypothetical protein
MHALILTTILAVTLALQGYPFADVRLQSASASLAPNCTPGKTAVIVTATVRNNGEGANIEGSGSVHVTDANSSWAGSASLPYIPPGQTVSVAVKLTAIDPKSMAGDHKFTADVGHGDTVSAALSVPAGFCAGSK